MTTDSRDAARGRLKRRGSRGDATYQTRRGAVQGDSTPLAYSTLAAPAQKLAHLFRLQPLQLLLLLVCRLATQSLQILDPLGR